MWPELVTGKGTRKTFDRVLDAEDELSSWLVKAACLLAPGFCIYQVVHKPTAAEKQAPGSKDADGNPLFTRNLALLNYRFNMHMVANPTAFKKYVSDTTRASQPAHVAKAVNSRLLGMCRRMGDKAVKAQFLSSQEAVLGLALEMVKVAAARADAKAKLAAGVSQEGALCDKRRLRAVLHEAAKCELAALRDADRVINLPPPAAPKETAESTWLDHKDQLELIGEALREHELEVIKVGADRRRRGEPALQSKEVQAGLIKALKQSGADPLYITWARLGHNRSQSMKGPVRLLQRSGHEVWDFYDVLMGKAVSDGVPSDVKEGGEDEEGGDDDEGGEDEESGEVEEGDPPAAPKPPTKTSGNRSGSGTKDPPAAVAPKPPTQNAGAAGGSRSGLKDPKVVSKPKAGKAGGSGSGATGPKVAVKARKSSKKKKYTSAPKKGAEDAQGKPKRQKTVP